MPRSRRSWMAAPRRSLMRSLSAGIVEQPGDVEVSRRCAEPLADRRRRLGLRSVPSPDLELDVTIDFPHPSIGAQQRLLPRHARQLRAELAAARTFGFVHEVDALRAKGLIQGASLENAVVLDDDGVIGRRRCAGPMSSCGTRHWTA